MRLRRRPRTAFLDHVGLVARPFPWPWAPRERSLLDWRERRRMAASSERIRAAFDGVSADLFG